MGMGVDQAGEHIFPCGINGMSGGFPLFIGDNLSIVDCNRLDAVRLIGRINHMTVNNQQIQHNNTSFFAADIKISSVHGYSLRSWR